MKTSKSDSGFEISAIIRTRRKTIALVIQRDGSLVVRAPLRVSGKLIREFAEKHSRWILKKQAQVRAMVPALQKETIPGETFLYLGRSFPLEIVKGQKTKLVLDGSFKLAESARQDAEEVFQRWYRARAKEIVPERVRLFAERNNLQFQKIRIGSARTRWGSCSSKGVLSFSWRLILAPIEVLDYVVIHELCHTLIHNHSSRFWQQVERILPNYREYNKWLRKNGQNVML
jgi:predicted metal-dependent hydrolase